MNLRTFSKNGTIKLIICLLFVSVSIYAQRNGDVLAFQGLEDPNNMSVRAVALGGAYTANSGDLGSIFYNPAGLAKISKLQISVSASYNNKMWRDNQIWYAGGKYLMLPEYMENLYTPPAEFNGIWSDSLGNPFGLKWNPSDIRRPVQGADHYSAEAADAEHTLNKIALDQLAVALPFQLFDSKFIAAVAFNTNYNPADYDWNGDHLDPHWGTSYDMSQLAPKDSIVRSNWDVYTRERTNGIKNLKGALAFELNESIQLGFGITSLFGSTDDNITLNRIGYYQFIQAGESWSFTYEPRTAVRKGTSDFSSLMFNVGGMLSLKNLNFGFNIELPHTITRDWSYTDIVNTSAGSTTSASSGTDKMKVPLCFNLGIKFVTSEKLSLYADLESKPYKKATFESTSLIDTTNFPVWVNQYTFSGGLEYKLFEDLRIMAGYRNRTATFIAYGNAIRDQGAPIVSYSLGASYNLPFGQISIAYELREMKYYDVYFTSRNYTLVRSNYFLVGYILSL